MRSVIISHKEKRVFTEINLVASKSLSNRALCIRLWCDKQFEIKNLSAAADTATFIDITERFKESPAAAHEFNVGPAGTVMRFLTAYFASVKCDVVLTGSERMKQRPLGILVDALRSLGADISYTEKEGFAPIHIKGTALRGGTLEIDGSISSQYISALLMLAPKLSEGLTLKFKGEIASKSYISMTLHMMDYFGVKSKWSGDTISISPQEYQGRRISIESDWSAASYWYAIAALSHDAKIKLNGLQKMSWQGDSIVAELLDTLGVKTVFEKGGVELRKRPVEKSLAGFDYDFSNCPDIAQTLAVVLAAKQIPAKLSGLATLKIKETDRINALKTELKKFDADCICTNDSITLHAAHFKTNATVEINTYDDHRMAMAFAPLALLEECLVIKDSEVVRKSYPTFYNDLTLAGFTIEEK